MKLIQQQFRVESEYSGFRLDQAVNRLMPDFSRSKVQEWIRQGFICLNREAAKPKQRVYTGDLIDVDVPYVAKISDRPEQVDFEIVHQDEEIIVVNKPANLVVHPAAGHESGTLVNGLLNIDSNLELLPRAGIVHRLDKDTTGIMVVARSLKAHANLVDQLQRRLVKREYLAITQGVVTAGRTIETGIARHPQNRKKMSVQGYGKTAITHFRVIQKFPHHSLIKVQLETGRTHQIRVHMAHLRYPLLGDMLYGGRQRMPGGISTELATQLNEFKRQALHAQKLGFEHPGSGLNCSFEAAIPQDFQNMLDALQESAHGS